MLDVTAVGKCGHFGGNVQVESIRDQRRYHAWKWFWSRSYCQLRRTENENGLFRGNPSFFTAVTLSIQMMHKLVDIHALD